MNITLLEKAYSCYMVHLDKLNYGNANRSYCLIYDAILALSNNITDDKYEQYFINNLSCGKNYPLNIDTDMNRLILWTLNSSETVDNSFSWTEVGANINTTYDITTNSVYGFNYFYVSVPQGVNVIIYNELDMKIYDSTLPADSSNQLFTLVGTMTTKYGATNNVLKKNDVYNTTNPVLFKVKLY